MFSLNTGASGHACACVRVRDLAGLAELGTMCDQYRSCSISEENGISASFTIAHELGHV